MSLRVDIMKRFISNLTSRLNSYWRSHLTTEASAPLSNELPSQQTSTTQLQTNHLTTEGCIPQHRHVHTRTCVQKPSAFLHATTHSRLFSSSSSSSASASFVTPYSSQSTWNHSVPSHRNNAFLLGIATLPSIFDLIAEAANSHTTDKTQEQSTHKQTNQTRGQQRQAHKKNRRGKLVLAAASLSAAYSDSDSDEEQTHSHYRAHSTSPIKHSSSYSPTIIRHNSSTESLSSLSLSPNNIHEDLSPIQNPSLTTGVVHNDISSHINNLNHHYGAHFTSGASNSSNVDTKCQKAFLHSAIRSLGSTKTHAVGGIEQPLASSSSPSSPEQTSPVRTTTQFFNNNFTRPLSTSLGRKNSAPNIPIAAHTKFGNGNNAAGKHTSPIAAHTMTPPINIPAHTFTLPCAAASTSNNTSSTTRAIHGLRKMKISRSPGALSTSPSYQSPLTSKLSPSLQAFFNPPNTGNMTNSTASNNSNASQNSASSSTSGVHHSPLHIERALHHISKVFLASSPAYAVAHAFSSSSAKTNPSSPTAAQQQATQQPVVDLTTKERKNCHQRQKSDTDTCITQPTSIPFRNNNVSQSSSANTTPIGTPSTTPSAVPLSLQHWVDGTECERHDDEAEHERQYLKNWQNWSSTHSKSTSSKQERPSSVPSDSNSTNASDDSDSEDEDIHQTCDHLTVQEQEDQLFHSADYSYFVEKVDENGRLTIREADLCTPQRWKALGLFISRSEKLVSLRFHGVDLSVAELFPTTAKPNRNLKNIQFVENNIGTHVHSSDPSTQQSSNTRRSSSLDMIVSMLLLCEILESVDIWRNNLGDEHVKDIARLLSSHKTLTKLSLCWNGIGEKGAKTIADVLLRLSGKHSCFKSLDLSYNRIPFPTQSLFVGIRNQFQQRCGRSLELNLSHNLPDTSKIRAPFNQYPTRVSFHPQMTKV